MTIHDMFHWKMLIPKNFVIKCVPNQDAYLNGCVLKWEAIVCDFGGFQLLELRNKW
jgi:hypothetical protein